MLYEQVSYYCVWTIFNKTLFQRLKGPERKTSKFLLIKVIKNEFINITAMKK